MKALIFICFFLSLSAFGKPAMVCYSRSELRNFKIPLKVVKNDEEKWILVGEETTCPMVPKSYNPYSKRYEGWIRIRPSDESDKCRPLAQELLAEDLNLHWLSMSREVQAGKAGFVQLGYQNIWDPGAGGTAKTWLKCYPSK